MIRPFAFLLPFFLSITSNALFGQSDGNQVKGNSQLTWQGGILQTFDLADKKVEGSYYLMDDFTKAKVYWKVGGDSSMTEQGNYHLILDDFVFLDKKEEKSIGFEMLEYFEINMGNGLVKFRHYSNLTSDPIDSKTSYVEEIFYDETLPVSVWRTWYINEVPPNYNEALNTGSKNTQLKRRSQFVLLVNESWYENFKLNKRSAKDVFPEKFSEVKAYLKENRPDDTREEMAKFGEFINSIL